MIGWDGGGGGGGGRKETSLDPKTIIDLQGGNGVQQQRKITHTGFERTHDRQVVSLRGKRPGKEDGTENRNEQPDTPRGT